MKRLTILCLALCLAGCAGTKFYLFGLDLDQLKGAGTRGTAELILGAAASVGVHTLGHVAFLELTGKSWHFENYGTREVCDDTLSRSERQWFGRAGFFSQSLVGTLLANSSARESFFVKGFLTGTAAELATYQERHGRHGGDLGLMRNEGEYVFYSTLALYNINILEGGYNGRANSSRDKERADGVVYGDTGREEKRPGDTLPGARGHARKRLSFEGRSNFALVSSGRD